MWLDEVSLFNAFWVLLIKIYEMELTTQSINFNLVAKKWMYNCFKWISYLLAGTLFRLSQLKIDISGLNLLTCWLWKIPKHYNHFKPILIHFYLLIYDIFIFSDVFKKKERLKIMKKHAFNMSIENSCIKVLFVYFLGILHDLLNYFEYNYLKIGSLFIS